MRGASPIASVGTRNDPFAPVGTGGGVGARRADVDVDEAAGPPSGTVVSAACFCVVSFEGSASGGIEVRGSSPISLASTVGIETRSPGRLSATITEASACFTFDTTGAAAVLGALLVALDTGLALSSRGAFFVSLAAGVVAGASVFASVVVAGAIGFAFAAGAAAFIGSVRPRSAETPGAGAVAADAAGAIGRVPGNGGENVDGVGRCGEGPGFAADATFAKIGATGPAGLDGALFAAAGPVDAAELVDGATGEGDSFSTLFPAGFSGSDGSPIHSS